MNQDVKKRKACQTCRERRIKCDLTQPACLQCTQGLRECPGYASSFRFRDETTKVKRRVRVSKEQCNNITTQKTSGQDVNIDAYDESWDDANDTSTQTQKTTSVTSNSSQNSPLPSWDDYAAYWETQCALIAKSSELPSVKSVDYGIIPSLPAALISPNLQLSQLFALFACFVMRAPRHNALPVMSAGSRWVGYLMQQAGENQLLDSSMKAVSLAYVGIIDPKIRESSRPYYSQAIRLMNSALMHKDQDRFVVTLSSTMLLSLFEMFMSDNHYSWIHHAGGAAALMRLRGASSFRYGPARNMFLIYRHHVIIQSTYRGQACFLAQPEWRQLTHDIISDMEQAGGTKPEHIKVWRAANAMYLASTRVPGVVQSFKTFRKSHGHYKPDGLKRQNLLQQGRLVLQATLNAFHGFSDLLQSLGHHPIETTYPNMGEVPGLNYVNMYVALYHMQYWTNVIMLHNLLQPLGLPPDEATELRELARKAAKKCLQSIGSLENSNLLSKYTFAFTLRLARRFVDDEEEISTIDDRIKAIENSQIVALRTTDYLNSLLSGDTED